MMGTVRFLVQMAVLVKLSLPRILENDFFGKIML